MADAATIKEFLVGIGFRFDESGALRVQQGIGGVGAAVERLQRGLGDAQRGIEHFAQSFTEIIESNRKTAESIENLRRTILEWGRTNNNTLTELTNSVGRLSKSFDELGGTAARNQGKVGGMTDALKDWGKVGLTAGAGWLGSMKMVGKGLDDLRKQAEDTGAASRDLAALPEEARKAVGNLQSVLRQGGRRVQFESITGPYLAQVQRDMPQASKAVQEHFAFLEAMANEETADLRRTYGEIFQGWSEQETQRRINNRNREIENFRAHTAAYDAAGLSQERFAAGIDKAAEAQQRLDQVTNQFKVVFQQAFIAAAPALISILKLVGGIADALLKLTSLPVIGPLAGIAVTFASFIPPALAFLKVIGSIKSVLALFGIGGAAAGAGGAVAGGGVIAVMFTGIQTAAVAALPAITAVLGPILAIVAAAKAAQFLNQRLTKDPTSTFADPNAEANKSGWRKWVFGDPLGLGTDTRGVDGEGPPGGGRRPSFQRGGIVNANLHEGEMVLPSGISRGLQDMMLAMRGAGGAAGSMGKRVNDQLSAWLAGGSPGPKVVIDNIDEFWREFLAAQARAQERKRKGADAAPGGAGAATAGGAGAGGAGGGGGGAGAAAGAATAAEGGPLATGGGGADWRTGPREAGPQTGQVAQRGVRGEFGQEPVPAMGEKGRGPAGEPTAGAPPAGEPPASTASRQGVITDEDRKLVQQSQAGIRNKPIGGELEGQLIRAAKEAGVRVQVTSGGQDVIGRGTRRTGSTRHDAGGAADVKLYDQKTGRLLDMTKAEDRERMLGFATSAVKHGATGIGAGTGYMGASTMHIGGGKPASWGGLAGIEQARRAGVTQREAMLKGGDAGGARPEPATAGGRAGRAVGEAVGGARAAVEKYLGKPVSDREYDSLMRATHAESGPKNSPEEQAMIMGSILNRARTNSAGITGALTAKNQFQAVTGTRNKPGPSAQYRQGPNDVRRTSIEGAATDLLHRVSEKQTNFTASSEKAYGPGTNIGWLGTLKQTGGERHGGTQFNTQLMKGQGGGVIPEGVLGGIMPLLAHAGEMVLPRELSQGLQAMIGGEGFRQFDRPIGGDTFHNYANRSVTINQTNNHTWANPQAIQTGRFRDMHDRVTGDLVRHFTSAMA